MIIIVQLTQKLKLLKWKFLSNGVFKCNIFVPESAKVKVKLLLNKQLKIKKNVINKKSVRMAVNKGIRWELITISCGQGSNNVVIAFNMKNIPVRNVKLKTYLVVDKILKEKIITIKHKTIKPVNKYDKPYPLMQDFVRNVLQLKQNN